METPLHDATGAEDAAPLPFRTLLYRYFFFAWLFRNVHTGNAFERGLAIQHNRRQARWLPVYMLRWAWCGLIFYALGDASGIFLESEVLARCFYAASALSLSVIVTMATAWVHLSRRSEHA
jgi:hypothetical protein